MRLKPQAPKHLIAYRCTICAKWSDGCYTVTLERSNVCVYLTLEPSGIKGFGISRRYGAPALMRVMKMPFDDEYYEVASTKKILTLENVNNFRELYKITQYED